MFHLKNIRELTCVFVAICILISHSLADDQEFLEDFLKREYSLAKPYRGELPVNQPLANKCSVNLPKLS